MSSLTLVSFADITFLYTGSMCSSSELRFLSMNYGRCLQQVQLIMGTWPIYKKQIPTTHLNNKIKIISQNMVSRLPFFPFLFKLCLPAYIDGVICAQVTLWNYISLVIFFGKMLLSNSLAPVRLNWMFRWANCKLILVTGASHAEAYRCTLYFPLCRWQLRLDSSVRLKSDGS